MIIPKVSQPLNFKGHDAAPIRNIYVDQRYASSFIDEFQKVAEKENFNIVQMYDMDKWGQDHKTIIERKSKPFALLKGGVLDCFIAEIKNLFNIDSERHYCYLTGGNCFLGQKENNEKWIMVGYDSIKDKDKAEVAKAYGVKEENIYVMPQQDYHLDMFMRPIGYPYVLVNDPNLVNDMANRLLLGDKKRLEDFRECVSEHNNYQQKKYCSVNETVEHLEKYGFVPIRVPGVWSAKVNFMNAIANKQKDGKISYITNSSKSEIEPYSQLEEIFESVIREKAPQIGNIYFIGEDEAMMHTLLWGGGGIHCMCVEEPYFSTKTTTSPEKSFFDRIRSSKK